jgi:hypothetical protein
VNEWVGYLVSAGFATIVVALLNAIFNRRKLSAEATEIITKAAAGTVENVVKDNEALRIRMQALEVKIDTLETGLELAERRERMHQLHEERWRYHMERWHRYVARLIGDLRAAGRRDIEDPPPMWPELPPTSP